MVFFFNPELFCKLVVLLCIEYEIALLLQKEKKLFYFKDYSLGTDNQNKIYM